MTAKEFFDKYKGCTYKITDGWTSDGKAEGVIIGYSRRSILLGHNEPWSWPIREGLSIDPKYKDKYKYGWWVDSFYRNNVISPLIKTIKCEELLEDYKQRFKDIDKIILNGKATIVILKNGSKGVVKVTDDDRPDARVGILEALLKARKSKVGWNTISDKWQEPLVHYVRGYPNTLT